MIKVTAQPIINKFGRASQKEIADAIGVTRLTVSAWLNGKPRTVELDILEKFARACEVEPGAFIVMTNDTRRTS